MERSARFDSPRTPANPAGAAFLRKSAWPDSRLVRPEALRLEPFTSFPRNPRTAGTTNPKRDEALLFPTLLELQIQSTTCDTLSPKILLKKLVPTCSRFFVASPPAKAFDNPFKVSAPKPPSVIIFIMSVEPCVVELLLASPPNRAAKTGLRADFVLLESSPTNFPNCPIISSLNSDFNDSKMFVAMSFTSF